MSTDKVTFSSRLRHERERLGMTQSALAEICGVSREVWGRYEQAKTMPGADVLLLFVKAGADPTFLLRISDTGKETFSSHDLSRDIKSSELLMSLANLSEESLEVIIKLIELLQQKT